ncbi:unnamed protein product [Rodentolepis nana]|uniref:Uncharacterized protein n=1 Tax=Rodentolepis nana TaxID=102285 RepID=A0A0R3T7Q4_RODNA|nr:unnamed protein product [Rodentolepis nana]
MRIESEDRSSVLAADNVPSTMEGQQEVCDSNISPCANEVDSKEVNPNHEHTVELKGKQAFLINICFGDLAYLEANENLEKKTSENSIESLPAGTEAPGLDEPIFEDDQISETGNGDELNADIASHGDPSMDDKRLTEEEIESWTFTGANPEEDRGNDDEKKEEAENELKRQQVNEGEIEVWTLTDEKSAEEILDSNEASQAVNPVGQNFSEVEQENCTEDEPNSAQIEEEILPTISLDSESFSNEESQDTNSPNINLENQSNCNQAPLTDEECITVDDKMNEN